ncbi:uncharacterized protein LOC125856035 [Solanum stenotomum]|uniref:uncharacterized protein LOC125856035 n=1 Tax=Solanum stenotomum TaxID=172797 RepID=UPI0020D1C94E|nr:uncharacterized protein LOC125856035 [Solanum stenotomum]
MSKVNLGSRRELQIKILHVAPKVNQERGSGPPFAKPTCHNCEKKHHGKFLVGTSGCYGCGKLDHQVRNCPTLTARGREAKQASLNGPNLDAPKMNHLYALQANKDKEANPDEGTNSSSAPKANQERGSGPPFAKPTCHNCGKKNHRKVLVGTSGCYGCGKLDHQVRNCPTLTARGREAKLASLNGPNLDAPKMNHLYALQANKDKEANPDEGTSKL